MDISYYDVIVVNDEDVIYPSFGKVATYPGSMVHH